MTNAQEWLDENYPKEKKDKIKRLLYSSGKDLQDHLDFQYFSNLKELNCSNNKLTSLNLDGLIKLRRIDVSNNQLEKLEVSNELHDLEELNCSGNRLSDANILDNLTNPRKLAYLNISNNNFPVQDLSFLSKFTGLKKLSVADNNFNNSLKHLGGVSDLEELDISDTNIKGDNDSEIDADLECLPKNLKVIHCEVDNKKGKEYHCIAIRKRLNLAEGCYDTGKKIYDYQKWLNREKSSNATKNGGILNSSSAGNNERENKLKIKTEWKHSSGHDELKEDHIKTGRMDYYTIHPKRFLNDFEERKLIDKKDLPTKLIDLRSINKDNIKVEEAEKNIIKTENLKFNEINYAILSYSWDATPWGKFKEDEKSLTYLLHNGSEKSLIKAIKACKEVNIDYLWMDVFCMDQRNENELRRELAEIRKYYGNAKVTLVAIQKDLDLQEKEKEKISYRLESGKDDMNDIFSVACDIIEIVTNSDWFQRSWTFQEGLLSPQTIFMFDDYLIDGRFLAMAWSLRKLIERKELPKLGSVKIDDFLKEHSEKVATPLGWAYYEGGYDRKDKVELGLFQAIEAIKNRKRYVSVDGIYSIMGLLPYKVEPKYKAELWKSTTYNYSEEEVVERLDDFIMEAVKNGYGEPLSWYGESSNLMGYCWMPKVHENGSMSIEKVIEEVKCEPDSVEFIKLKGEEHKILNRKIKIKGSKYKIIATDKNDIDSIDGLCDTKILIGVGVENKKNQWIHLRVMGEILKKIKDDIGGEIEILLLVPDQRQWKRNPPVALLVRETGKGNNFHRIDLVEILEGSEHLVNSQEDLIIGMNKSSDDRLGKGKNFSETHACMEIPPKQ